MNEKVKTHQMASQFINMLWQFLNRGLAVTCRLGIGYKNHFSFGCDFSDIFLQRDLRAAVKE